MKLAQGSSVLITGGSSGLGRACVDYFAQQGWHVIVFDINAKAEADLLETVAQDKLSFYCLDVSHESQVKSAFAKIKEANYDLRLCINCAGIAPAKRTLDREANAYDLSLFSQVITINLVGSFNVAKEAAATMATNSPDHEQQRGVIINTASVAAYEGQIGQTAYAASKAGIVGLTLPMARDLAPLGIRVNTIAPGIMGTPMLLAMPENVQDALKANVPNPKRLGKPEEFAKLAEHIYQNTYLNGETLRLDGALRMPPK